MSALFLSIPNTYFWLSNKKKIRTIRYRPVFLTLIEYVMLATESMNYNTDSNRESPTQFENRIKPRVYVRRITRSNMYQKSPILLAIFY